MKLHRNVQTSINTSLNYSAAQIIFHITNVAPVRYHTGLMQMGTAIFLNACVMGGGIGFESQFSYGWRNISNTMCINKLMDCTYCKPYKNTRYMFSLEVYKLFMTTHEQIRSNVLLLTEMVTAMHTYLVHNVSTGPVYPTLWYTTHILCLCASICPYLSVNHC